MYPPPQGPPGPNQPLFDPNRQVAPLWIPPPQRPLPPPKPQWPKYAAIGGGLLVFVIIAMIADSKKDTPPNQAQMIDAGNAFTPPLVADANPSSRRPNNNPVRRTTYDVVGEVSQLAPPELPGFVLSRLDVYPTPILNLPPPPQTGIAVWFTATDSSGIRLNAIINESSESLTEGIQHAQRVTVNGHSGILAANDRPDQVWIGWQNDRWQFLVWILPRRVGDLREARQRALPLANAMATWADPYVTHSLTNEQIAQRRARIEGAVR